MVKMHNQDLGNQELNDMQQPMATSIQSQGIEYQEITLKNKVKISIMFLY